MSYLLSVKDSQSIYRNTGYLFQGTWYVDDSLKNGLNIATFCCIESGKSKCSSVIGFKQATLFPSGKNINRKASGLIYTTSAIDRYERTDDMSDEYRLFPYGDRQFLAIGLLKQGVVTISTKNKENIYRTVDTTLENVKISNSKITDKNIVSKLQYGDKIEINSIHYYIEKINEKEAQIVPELKDYSGSIVIKCQIDDPVYLNNEVVDNLKNGEYHNLNELPFTTVRAKVGELDQLVGYIESPTAVRIDLSVDIDPSIRKV